MTRTPSGRDSVFRKCDCVEGIASACRCRPSRRARVTDDRDQLAELMLFSQLLADVRPATWAGGVGWGMSAILRAREWAPIGAAHKRAPH